MKRDCSIKTRVIVTAKYAIMILLAGCCAGCRAPRLPQSTFLAMGAFFTFTLPADQADFREPVNVLSANILYDLEDLLSFYREGSDVSRLNMSAGSDFIDIAPTTITLLNTARRYSDLSAGAFDITVAPLLALWGLRGGAALKAPPTPEALEAVLPLVNYRHLEIENNAARLTLPGMQLDLGGIAKGFAVDEIARTMLQHGVKNVLLNLGGNIRVLGKAAPDKPWRVAVRDPFNGDRVLGWLDLRDGEAVATSGNYERFINIDGVRYAHIINPRNGQALTDMAAVTILSSSPDAAMDADALSTTLFVMGVESGANFLRANFPEQAALFVPNRQPLEIHVTPEFAMRLIVASDYTSTVKLIP